MAIDPFKKKLSSFIEKNIHEFHENRLRSLNELRLDRILLQKNPYLFRAKHLNTAAEIIESLLSAYLSSREEILFGDFLEKVAVYTCSQSFNGKKSSAEGIDLEFSRAKIYYLVSIKSGPNWGNSQQIRRMEENFKKAYRILGGNSSKKHIVAINGCCYGRDNKPEKDGYLKLCGEPFWSLISGRPSLYLDLIKSLGHRAKEKNEAFLLAYERICNSFTRDFLNRFCLDNGDIDWSTLVKLNSAEKNPATTKTSSRKNT
ncbi:MAG: cytosolic protein [Burkholderiales bacterium]|jgi:hypothetical protein|nr:cytosolic protein [Burkholderiales bacterium]